jgi:deazaflavin-dependent oxidoreductase (nitroreductase family)
MSEVSGPNTCHQHIIEQFCATGGATDFPGPELLLRTIGAKSGLPGTTPLGYVRDGDHLVIIAAAEAMPTEPDWYHNLVAHPVVSVGLGSDTFQATATVIEGSERDRLYALIALYPGYVDYRQKAIQYIPINLLTRRDARIDEGVNR